MHHIKDNFGSIHLVLSTTKQNKNNTWILIYIKITIRVSSIWNSINTKAAVFDLLQPTHNFTQCSSLSAQAADVHNTE